MFGNRRLVVVGGLVELPTNLTNLPLTGLMLVLVGLADQPTTTSNLSRTSSLTHLFNQQHLTFDILLFVIMHFEYLSIFIMHNYRKNIKLRVRCC